MQIFLPGNKGDSFKIGPCLSDAMPVYDLGTSSCQARFGKPGRTIRNQRNGVVGWSGCCPERQTLGQTQFGLFSQCSSMKAWQKRAGKTYGAHPELAKGFVDSLKKKWAFIEDDPLRLAGTVAGLVFVGGWTLILCCCCFCFACRDGRGSGDHKRLKSVEEGTAVAPEVMGKPTTQQQGADHFVIGDEDDNWLQDDDGDLELEPMDFEFDVGGEEETPPGRSAHRSAFASPSRQGGVIGGTAMVSGLSETSEENDQRPQE